MPPKNSAKQVPIPTYPTCYPISKADTPPADRYKLEQNYKRAGEVFEKSADLYLQLASTSGSSQESGYSGAARAFDEAHVAYKMISPELGIPPLKKSIEGFQNASNLRRAATKWEELAKLYEGMGDLANANEAYKTAARLYMGQSQEAIANKSRVRNAELTAVLANGDFNALVESKEIYLAVARSNLANNTLRFAVKDHLFHYGCMWCFHSNSSLLESLTVSSGQFVIHGRANHRQRLRRIPSDR
jgi:hypothetical protein